MFVSEMRHLLREVPNEKIFNVDQSGINLEMVLSRTLAVKGTKTVETVAQRVSATTHNLSI